MKRFFLTIVLTISALCVFSQGFTKQRGTQPYTVSFAQPQPGVYQLTFEILNVSTGEVTKNGLTYTKILFASSTTTDREGWAELPFVSGSIQLPADKDVEISDVALESESSFTVNYPLLPSRGVIYRHQDPSAIPYRIAPESQQDALYPSEFVTMESPYIVRDVRGTTVHFYPFQYNAATNTVTFHRKVTVTLRENNHAATNPLTHVNPTPVREAIGLYQSMFLNYEPSRQALAQGEKGDIFVFTTAAYEDAADAYVQWKKEMGYNVTKEVVSNNATLATSIQSAYNDNNNLMYVQLFGDWDNIKTTTITADYSTAPADPKTGCVAGNDNRPDIAIGRFSCSSNAQALVQVNKAINYEKNPNMDAGWRETFIGIGSSEGSGNGDDGEIDYVHVQRIYSERLDPFTYDTENGCYGDNSTASTLANYVNAGASTIAYCGHGAETYFVTTNYNNNNVNASTNGDRLPFVVAVACVNGKFNQSGDCFAEAWLKKENGGAVVTLMSTINQPWTPPQRGQDYFYDILTGGFNYSAYSGQNGINNEEQRTHWGSIVVNAFNLALAESSTSSDLETFQTWTTFGDASLQLRTKQPEAIASSMNTLMSGIPFSTTITKNGVPVADALVCISQNDVYYSAYTDANGQVSIMHDFIAGDVLLVVTAFNTTTIYQTIPCTAGNVPYLVLESYTPDIVEFGQQPYLTFTMKNMGGVATTGNTTVTITCDDPMMTILDNTATFGVMAASGGTATDNNGFQLSVANDVATGHIFTVNYTATCGSDSWTGSVNLMALGSDCAAPTGMTATATGNSITLTWDDNSTIEQVTITEDVEGHTYGTINSAGTIGWNYIDGDNGNTGTFNGLSYTNAGEPMAFVVLDDSQMSGSSVVAAHSGHKYFGDAYSYSGSGWYQTAVQNDDWIISPELNFMSPFTFSFYARSYSSSYSSEKFYAAYSTTGTNASDFTNLSSEVTTTTTWTQYTYTVPANAKYVAVHCVSNDQYIFCLDDIVISGEAGNGNHYNLYRDGELIAANITGGTYTDNNLSDGTYCYTLRVACMEDFESAGTTECATVGTPVQETCDAPTGLQTTNSASQIGLNWNAVENAIAYRIYRNGSAIATTPNNNYIDANVQPNVTYSYAVQTICTSGESGISNTVNGQTTDIAGYTAENVRIYPNPATQVLNVAGNAIAEISIYSAIGKLVRQIRPTTGNTEINVSAFGRGIYMVKIVTADGQMTTRKVVLK